MMPRPGDKLNNQATVLLTSFKGHDPEHGIALCDYHGELVTWQIWKDERHGWLTEGGRYFEYDDVAEAARSFADRSQSVR